MYILHKNRRVLIWAVGALDASIVSIFVRIDRVRATYSGWKAIPKFGSSYAKKVLSQIEPCVRHNKGHERLLEARSLHNWFVHFKEGFPLHVPKTA